MSVLGTGVVAGVAQVSLQSKQEAKKRDRLANDQAGASREVRETMEAHLQGLEEGDSGDSVDRVHIDAQVPEHQHEQMMAEALEVLQTERPSPPVKADASKRSKAAKPDGGLYQHLDVKA